MLKEVVLVAVVLWTFVAYAAHRIGAALLRNVLLGMIALFVLALCHGCESKETTEVMVFHNVVIAPDLPSATGC